MITIDASDPGHAAKLNFAAAWLYAHIAMYDAQNRRSQSSADQYSPVFYAAAIEDAEQMAGIKRETTT